MKWEFFTAMKYVATLQRQKNYLNGYDVSLCHLLLLYNLKTAATGNFLSGERERGIYICIYIYREREKKT